MTRTEYRKRVSQIFLTTQREQVARILCHNLNQIRSKENDHHLQKRQQG